MAVRFLLAEDEPAKEWSCESCFADPKSESKRRRQLCDGDTNPNIAFAFAPELRICPVGYITDTSWAMVRWWQDWKAIGMLPYHGHMADQPAFVPQALMACEAALAKVNAERAKANG